MVKKENIVMFAGASIMTLAILIQMGLNINPNNRNKTVYLNNSQKICAPKNDEENLQEKRKGR